MTPLDFAGLSQLSLMRTQKKVSSVELIEYFLDRIRSFSNPSNAFISTTAQSSLQTARQCDQHSGQSGALYGLPYSVKDLIDVAGEITTAGSHVLENNKASDDAYIVSRMRAEGAICLGKNNLHEFAYGATGENSIYGTAVNAYDVTRLAGGSSSGSAAAVAFGLIPAAFGTDTGGSVRAPAALSGLVGLKPTSGRVSLGGVIPYCWTLDHVGMITRNAQDAALLLQATAGYDPLDPGSVNTRVEDYLSGCQDTVGSLTVGLPKTFFFERADPEILSAIDKVIRYLEKSGANLVDIDMPDMTHCRTVSLTVQMPEALSYHMPLLNEKGDLYSTDFRAGLALGQCILAEHYVRAKRMISNYRQQTNKNFEQVDLILTPATPIIAPKLDSVNVNIEGTNEAIGNAITRYTTFFNMTGHPAITLPCAMHSKGLPIGVQLIGRYFDESLVLKVANMIQNNDNFKIPNPAVV